MTTLHSAAAAMLLFACGTFLPVAPGTAQTHPARPVRLTVGFPRAAPLTFPPVPSHSSSGRRWDSR